MGGMDSLPDYYGAAFVAADKAPRVRVYLLSRFLCCICTCE